MLALLRRRASGPWGTRGASLAVAAAAPCRSAAPRSIAAAQLPGPCRAASASTLPPRDASMGAASKDASPRTWPTPRTSCIDVARRAASTTSQGKGKGKSKAANDSEVVRITPRAADYARWYRDVIAAADLVDRSAVKGCMIIKPHGYALWELLRDSLDRLIKETGHSNAYFPLFIPQSFLSREAEHVAGFAKECAVVTHHRLRAVPGGGDGDSDGGGDGGGGGGLEPDPDAKLPEPYVVRPTSEAVMWDTFSRWIRSHRDLPLLINQWANVVRWEMRTRPFLRTSEFLWQEGHTAHATAAEARDEATRMLDVYQHVAEHVLAIPVVPGHKSPSERFAGADDTLTIEAMMQNGWALQCGTSHFLGQSFAKAFDVTFDDEDGERKHVWATSWGVSTRLVGAAIMTHSDDTGLVLPPAVAPVQVVIIPISGKKGSDAGGVVRDTTEALCRRLKEGGVRAVVDDRSYVHPGAKYFEWERKGVPLRIEVGPRDVAAHHVSCKRRVGDGERFALQYSAPGAAGGDGGGSDGGGDSGIVEHVSAVLEEIQVGLLETARQRLEDNTRRIDSYDEMREVLMRATASGVGIEEAAYAGGDVDRRDDDDDADDGADAQSESVGHGAQFYLAPWKDDADNEAAIKADCKATVRCFPFEGQEEAEGKTCFYSGEPATHMALFARAY